MTNVFRLPTKTEQLDDSELSDEARQMRAENLWSKYTSVLWNFAMALHFATFFSGMSFFVNKIYQSHPYWEYSGRLPPDKFNFWPSIVSCQIMLAICFVGWILLAVSYFVLRRRTIGASRVTKNQNERAEDLAYARALAEKLYMARKSLPIPATTSPSEIHEVMPIITRK